MLPDSSISIIIPALNEADTIGKLLSHLKRNHSKCEIIVADGGSRDGTVQRVRNGAKLIECPSGRAVQMNRGAEAASGEIFWFLHADSFPHPHSVRAIRESLKNPETVGGAFEYNLDQEGFIYRLSEILSNRKNHILKLFFGDMGIFVRRETFEKINGFAEIPLMEDLDFCVRLKKQGKIKIIPLRITTSARRWEAEGPWKNIFRNWFLQIAWALGTSPEKLKNWYQFGNGIVNHPERPDNTAE